MSRDRSRKQEARSEKWDGSDLPAPRSLLPASPRWRVDCRRQRGLWRTVQYESYDDVDAALRALAAHCLEDWDAVDLVQLSCQQGLRRVVLAMGGRLRAGDEDTP
jgi:hypothetical protein